MAFLIFYEDPLLDVVGSESPAVSHVKRGNIGPPMTGTRYDDVKKHLLKTS